MIEIENLTKTFGTFTAVNDISLKVKEGEICSFLGVNGAGKTTTLRMLAGTLKPTNGTIQIAGFNLGQDPLSAKLHTGYIPDRPYLYPGLTARELLYFTAELYAISPRRAEDKIDELLDAYALNDWQDDLIESFSHGMKQRLATCAAVLPEPKVLIVDEPMVGLDPHGAKLLKKYFRNYAANGMTIFISTHSLHVAEEVSDCFAVINAGRIIARGTLDELRDLSGLGGTGLEEIFIQLTLQD